MKNPNGFGSVYKLSGNRRRPWIAVVSAGKDDNGKQVRKVLGSYETKRDALEGLSLYKYVPVVISSKEDITLDELYTEWSVAKYAEISKATENSYKGAWAYYKSLKDVRFQDLRTAHFQQIIDDCRLEGKSRSLMEKIKVLMYMLYQYAIEPHEIVNKNYAEFIKLPKVEKVEREIFSDLEIQKIENAVTAGVPWADTVLILLYTGFRIGEFLSLTRFSVDLEQQIITGGIKTDAGKNRIIPIHSKITKYIAAWYSKNGSALICRDNGSKLSEKYYREKCYYPALEQIGVRRLTPHACRHTFASLMAKVGADTKSIQLLMGHTTYSFTADTYTHVNITQLQEAIKLL